MLGSVLPHTLDIKNGLLFTQGGASLQLHRRDSALSGRVFTVGHSSIPPYSEAVLHCSVRTTGGRALPSSGLLEGLTLFAEETGLIVGRTLVDPSGWKVPVLVSNFSQETVMVNPFTEVGMIAQVTAIQSVTDDETRRCGAGGELPLHLRDLVDQTSVTWTGIRDTGWQKFCWNMLTSSLFRESRLLAIQTRWNTIYIRATGHPSGAPHVGCPRRR